MKQRGWRVALLANAIVIASYFLVASTNVTVLDAVYLGVGTASVLCMLVGIRMHRPARRWAWLAMAASNVCFVAGDAGLDYYDVVLHRAAPFPSIADALYLAGYPCLAVAVIALIRSWHCRGSREDRADAAIVTVGALALLWQVLVGAYAHDSTVSMFGKVVTMAYPIMDIGLLFIVVHALFAAQIRNAAAALVATGMAAMLIGDLGYDLLILHGAYRPGNPVDAAWLISYAVLGAAALHPSMAARGTAKIEPVGRRSRLPVVALCGFIAPTISLVAGISGSSVDTPVLAGISIVLFVLVIARVTWLLRRLHEQTLSLSQQSQQLQAALVAQSLLEDDLRHRAFHDSLTGLANRALLHDRAEQALLASARATGTAAALFCDLDGFKTINDSLGHHAGDRLLVVVAKRLTSIVRAGDTVARLGADEFAVLMPNVDDPVVALTTAERILSVIRQPIEVDGQMLTISGSVGVSFGGPAKSVETLFSEADSAMYAAKARGAGRVESFEDQMRSSLLRSLTLRNGFNDALRRGEFYVHYQPHVSLQSDQLEGFEALIRWRHPTQGAIQPTEFIPLAEQTGFIIPLGRWVLETACIAAATWPHPPGRLLTVAVNISALQLQSPQIIGDVSAALSFSGLLPKQLVLEVTETMLMADPVETTAILSRLKALGVRVAIDDFGTGYSSLSYLRQFPIDIIKIDKSFVDPLADPANEADAFVSTIIRLAHDLRLTTIAEGVEDRRQERALVRLGCDSAQGYLFSRPLDEHLALAFAVANARRPARQKDHSSPIRAIATSPGR